MATKKVGKVAMSPKGDWNAVNAYERLDIVMYNDVMYVAKQPVPAGTPTSNTNYWMRSISGSGITFDPSMSDTSDNGAQNKVIKSYVDSEHNGIVNESYNLIPYPYYRPNVHSENGITFTCDDSGVIAANGTCTVTSYYGLYHNPKHPSNFVVGKQYALTLETENGMASVFWSHSGSDMTAVRQVNSSKKSVVFTLTAQSTSAYSTIGVYIVAGTYNNLKIKVTIAEVDSNGNYPTNYMCGSLKGITDINNDLNLIVKNGVKNILSSPYYDGSSKPNRGIDYVANADGSILASGEVSETGLDSYYNLAYRKTLSSGIYKLTDGISDSADGKYWAVVWLSGGDEIARSTRNNGIFILTTQTTVDIQVRVYRKTTVSNLLFKPMLQLISSDGTYSEDYVQGEINPIIDTQIELSESLEKGSYNLLPFPYFDKSKTYNGVTYEVCSDGSIKLSGSTPSGTESSFILLNYAPYTNHTNPTIKSESGKFYLSGTPKNANGKAYLQVGGGTADYPTWRGGNVDNGYGAEFTAKEADGKGFYLYVVRIMVNAGKNVDGLVFKPMVTEIYENGSHPHTFIRCGIKGISEISSDLNLITKNGIKNLIPYPFPYKYPASDYENGGITYHFNSDGSVTANGTSTATSYCNLIGRTQGINILETGKKYRLSGCPSDKNDESWYSIQINTYQEDMSTAIQNVKDLGSGGIIDVTSHYNNLLLIRVGSGRTLNNVVFKPMLQEINSDGTYSEDYIQGEVKSIKELTGLTDITLKNGIRNLIPYPYISTTSSPYGITFTDIGDGTIILSGTQDGSSKAPYFGVGQWWLSDKAFGNVFVKANTRIAASLGTEDRRVYGRLLVYNTSGTRIDLVDFYGTDVAIRQYNVDVYVAYAIQTLIGGITLSNVVVRPMIVEVDENGNYPTEYVCGETKSLTTLSRSFDIINDEGSYNLFPYPYYNNSGHSHNGITYTYSNDGIITLNGKSTGNSFFDFNTPPSSYPLILTPGTYMLTSGHSYYEGGVALSGVNQSETVWYEVNTPFTITEDTHTKFYIYVKPDITLSNYVIKPMLVKVDPNGKYPTRYMRGSIKSNLDLTTLSHNVLGDEYNPTTTYKLNDLCVYNNKIYKCIVSSVVGKAPDCIESPNPGTRVAYWSLTNLSALYKNTTTSLDGSISSINSDMYYKKGDTVTTSKLYLGGYITSGAKSARVTIPMPKRLDNVDTITVSACVGGIRTVDGKYLHNLGDTDEWVGEEYITVTATKGSSGACNTLCVMITTTDTFANAPVNNTPLGFNLKFTFKLS